MTIAQSLVQAESVLSSITDTPRLEAEVLLTHVLQVGRSYLHTWPERLLTSSQQDQFEKLIKRRVQGEPIAYLTGHKEFWSLDLVVTPDVLIPRPETELLVECALEKGSKNDSITVADLGTGSGAIALAIASERPNWTVHAIDKSIAALEIAQFNARQLNISNVMFHQGYWFEGLPADKFHVIVSNPPYIAEDDAHLSCGDLRYEPRDALVSGKDGLEDIIHIILQAKNHLKPGGWLLIEHGFQQAENIVSIFTKAGYTDINTHQDLAGLDRVTIASWMGF